MCVYQNQQKAAISGLPFAGVFLKLKLDFRRITYDKHKDSDHSDIKKGGHPAL